MGSRTIVVGDVHGCLEELDELLSRLEVGPSDRLVLAGDLMDRGPDPVGVVRRARERGALAVLGNHDEKHLRFARHEAKRRTVATKSETQLCTSKSRHTRDLSCSRA